MISIVEMMTSAASYRPPVEDNYRLRNITVARKALVRNYAARRYDLFRKAMYGKGLMLAKDIAPLVGRNLCNTHRSLRYLISEGYIKRVYPCYEWVGE